MDDLIGHSTYWVNLGNIVEINDNSMNIKASYDKMVWIITIFTVLTLTGLVGFSLYEIFFGTGQQGSVILHVIIIISQLLILIVTYGFAPSSYSLQNDAIIIHRKLFGDKKIDLSQVESIREITDGEMKGSIRTFGVGGLFGFFGYFRSRVLGSYRMYGSRWSNFVLIELRNGKKLLITPDDTKAMLLHLEQGQKGQSHS